jgi:hypothetical protein
MGKRNYQHLDAYRNYEKKINENNEHKKGSFFMTFNTSNFIDNKNEFMPHISQVEYLPDKFNNEISNKKWQHNSDAS